MERIKTASRIIDLFAPPAAVGRDGFGDLPPDQTQLDASFFNNVQETLAQAIEGQGIALDGLDFNQLTEAINIWSTFVLIGLANGGTFTMTDSSELVVEADGGNGGSTISLGGILTGLSTSTTEFQSGATFRTLIGAIVSLLGDVVIGTTSANTLAIESTFTKVILADLGIKGTGLGVGVNFPDGATVAAGTDLGLGANATISGDDTTSIDVGRTTILDLEFDDAGTTLPASVLRVRWNETTPTAHMPDGTIRSWPIPARGLDLVFTTAGGIASTSAIATARIQETETVRIEITFDYEHTSGLLGTLNTRIEVNGTPGTIDIDTLAHLLPASAGVRWRDKTLIFYWRPDDDFIAPGTEDYQFTVRMGSGLGLSLNARNIDITVESAIFV